MLQDSQIPEIHEMLEFRIVRPLRTVYEYLAERNALDVLRDPRLALATGEIHAEGKPRPVVDRELRAKEMAVSGIARQYASGSLSEEDIRQCIGSIGDNHNFLV